MTTNVTIHNHASSNGDVAFTRANPSHKSRTVIAPGEKFTVPVSGNDDIHMTEFWPQRSPPTAASQTAAEFVDQIIAREAETQVAMWGAERPDNKSNELLAAAVTTAVAVAGARGAIEVPPAPTREEVFAKAQESFYPRNWSPNAFRDYGSDFANLAVVAAYIRNQMTIMFMNGEDTKRSKRPDNKPYNLEDRPAMPAEQVAGGSRRI
jgi:hypothetical protein